MYLFDTNMLQLLINGDLNVLEKVRFHSPNIWVSSITAEETLIGRMNIINRARAPRTSLSLPQAHQDFVESLGHLQVLPVRTYSEEAVVIYRAFPAAIIRIGAQDCRIAAQALAHSLTVVTRNTRDFAAIGAPCADWSA